MPDFITRPWIAAGVALLTAGVTAVGPAPVPHPNVTVRDIALVAGGADIVLDFVRHGQSQDNVDKILGTLPPGAPLTDVGKEQAIAVGQQLYNDGDNTIGGVFASQLLRTQQTSWPLDQLLLGSGTATDIPNGPPPLLDPDQILPGLNEVNAGFLEGAPLNLFTEIAYVLPPAMWMLGLYLVPVLGSSIDPNGMAFEDRFSAAVQTIYNASTEGSAGADTQVAFAHAGSIAAWTLMNVKNPDFGPLLNDLIEYHQPVANTGQVVIEGNPTDGWTLLSWDGKDVGPGNLFTELFVAVRSLITAPQMAFWHLVEAIFNGGPTDAMNAVPAAFDEVGAALVQFPQTLVDSIAGAFQDDAAGLPGVLEPGPVLLDSLAAI